MCLTTPACARPGCALLLLQRLPQAETNLRREIELDATLVTPRLHRGDVLAAAGDVSGSPESWSEVLKLAPDPAGANERLERLGP